MDAATSMSSIISPHHLVRLGSPAAARSTHGDRDDIRRIQSLIGEVLLRVAGLVPTT
jgi:hypothetical protein